MTDTISVVVDRPVPAHDCASEFELAMVAAQARSSISRIREFVGYEGEDEAAFDRVMKLLHDMIPDMVMTPR